ncbi:MAG TPA: hypothetical protein VNM69_03815 [Bacillus sp. (in: firmicutes)]|nr:hypothetical protein [Bacillus sp. (in: firmicutes)]
MNVHLVFPPEYIEPIQQELEQIGYRVSEVDTGLDTFAQWATSKSECISDVAFIYGAGHVSVASSQFSQKQAIYERLREVRIARQHLRLVVVFPSVIEEDKDFISRLVQLGIHDLHLTDDLSIDDIKMWLDNPRSLADVQVLIGNYVSSSRDTIDEVTINQRDFQSSHQEREVYEEIHSDIEDREDVNEKEKGHKRFNLKVPTISVPNLSLPKFKKEKTKDTASYEREEQGEETDEESPTSRLNRREGHKRKLNIQVKMPSFSIASKTAAPVTAQMIQPKTIVVGSLHGGAGSTFLIHNFTRYLSKRKLVSGVLEASYKNMIWYEKVTREIGKPHHFEAWYKQLKRNPYLTASARIALGDTHILPYDMDDELSEDVTEENARILIHTAKQIPLLFIDISSDWDNPIAQQAIQLCDEFWIVTRPDPDHLFSQRHAKRTFMNKAAHHLGGENCLFIGNAWESDIDEDVFPIDTFVTIPYLEENIEALMKGLPLYEIQSKWLEKPFNALAERILSSNHGKHSIF